MLVLPHYTVTGVLHEGERRTLYDGRRDRDRLPVVIKIVRGAHPSPRDIARIRHEYAMLAELSLPGVARAIALEQCATGPALVLERLSGRSLRDLLDQGPLDLTTTLAIASSLAGALSAIHRRHVIHKDVTPRNVLVDLDPLRVTLIDFGIATRLSQESPRIESPTALEGTLAYMSPEQTGRMNRAVDARADLYSLGVTLYEMLTAALPFGATDPMELVHSHIARTPPRPSDRVAALPEVVSDIVMKLLAKAAEDRYQSAEGLEADLNECRSRRSRGGWIEPFTLTKRDFGAELRLPQKLYGREAEIAVLEAAFERVSLGAAEILLVKGAAGVGKSALVNEIHQSIARRGGYFGAGKCEQLGHGVPYGPVTHALRQVFRRVLTESAESLARWKGRLLSALESNARLVVDLIPELELCVGPQPSAPAVGAAEAKSRFTAVFQSFLRACTAEGGLVLFLDDLQWGDPASLSLLELLLRDPDSTHLLLIGAYRDDEVDEAHPLTRALDALRRSGAAPTEITLAPLPLASVAELLTDALAGDASRIPPLAELVFTKTRGNPFFLGQFLRTLHSDGLLYRDPESGSFTWDTAEIARAALTDNVVDFLVRRMKQLSPRTQRALALAACIGHRFDRETLATVSEPGEEGAADDLWEALEEDLIVPLDPDYRFFAAPLPITPQAAQINVAYRFSHDRVQQAAYALIEDGRKQEAHLRIGRRLRAELGGDPEGDALLGAVTHLNLGAALITDAAERAALARWNLVAGRKAKQVLAYEAAARYLRCGAALLDEAAREADPALTAGVLAEQAECAYLSGHFDEAEALYDALLQRVASATERADIQRARVALYASQGRYDAALAAGRAGLADLGITFPDAPDELDAAVRAALAEVPKNLGDRRIDELTAAPVIVDPAQRAILRLLADLWVPTQMAFPAFRSLIVVTQVNFSLENGNSEVSAFGYMAYASLIARAFGRIEEARAFGRLALALDDRFNIGSLTPNLNFVFGTFAHLCDPLHAVAPYLERAFRLGLNAGELTRSSWASAVLPTLRFCSGVELAVMEAEIDQTAAILRRRTWNEMALALLAVSKQLILKLTGRAPGRATLGGGDFDEEAVLALMPKPGFEFLAWWYYLARLELAFFHGDHAVATAMAARAEAEARRGTTLGSFIHIELVWFAFLSNAALSTADPPEAADARAADLDRHQAEMAIWAGHCPWNYQNKYLLMRAERARLGGQNAEAMELYDQAIEAARAADFVRDEAIACEVAARFYMGLGRERVARAYLSDARNRYLRWGATAKVHAIDDAHPDLSIHDDRAPSSATPRAGRGSDALDVMSIVRAAQAIAGEIELDKVLDRLLRITLSNAGAQRGALLLEHDGRLWLEATISVQPDLVRIGPRRPLSEAATELSTAIVQYVERTREPVVLADAQREAQFSGDPYLARARPRSVLCLSLVHQGRLTGVLYLENNAATDTFTPARIEVCRLLSSQAAIAVENALLYARVQAAREELQRTNEGLEQAVLRRTEELRVEMAQREALQSEIIRVQGAQLVKMSTPLIPISDRVMVLPLMGTLDATRSRHVLETALTGASANRAKVVIVDITGIERADEEVAAMLVQMAGALGLLGAEVVITGIQPEVAQALVAMGVELGAIVTRGTLQGGIAYALGRTGERRGRAARMFAGNLP